jgi:hypothetical protein
MSFNYLLRVKNIGLFIILTNKNLICVSKKSFFIKILFFEQKQISNNQMKKLVTLARKIV